MTSHERQAAGETRSCLLLAASRLPSVQALPEVNIGGIDIGHLGEDISCPAARVQQAGVSVGIRRIASSPRAMHAKNTLTALGAGLVAPFHPRVPAAVTLLDYYGRELELWSGERNLARLHSTADAMARVWAGVRDSTNRRGGSATAARFDALVARASRAQTAPEFARVAKPVIDEVDKFEAVFTQ